MVYYTTKSFCQLGQENTMDSNGATSISAARTEVLVNHALSLYRSSYKEEMKQALASIPDFMRREYDEALQQCSNELIDSEAPSLLFLRQENFNAYAAAVRMITYWKRRKQVFGESRAYLPLSDLSGRGALSMEDVRFVQSGVLSVTRSYDSDPESIDEDTASEEREEKEELPVLVFNPLKLADSDDDPSSTLQRCKRCCFYLAYQMKGQGTASASEPDGFILAVLLSKHGLRNLPLERDDRSLLELLENALPIRVMHLLLICSSPKGERMSATVFERELVPKALSHVSTRLQEVSTPVFGETVDDVLEQFAECSLTNLASNQMFRSQLSAALALEANLHDDKDGELSDSLADSPLNATTWKHSQNQLRDAIDMIDEEQKSAYIEAMRVCPELVDKETPSLRFLRFAKFDPWAAAKRLTSYWNIRKEMFGDKAFLPMSFDQGAQKCALGEVEIAIAKSGFQAILPKDNSGAMSICLDYERLSEVPSHSFLSRSRVLFFLLQKLSESASSMNLVVIVAENMIRLGDRRNTHVFIRLLRQAMPLSYRKGHALFLIPRQKWRSYLHSCIASFMKANIQSDKDWVEMHIASSKAQMASRLEVWGFPKHIIPERVGGSWSHEKYLQSIHYDLEGDLKHVSDAKRRCPGLVETELPMDWFLTLESGNAEIAERRRNLYWQERRALFGERAYFPLSQTGDGVLDSKETSLLSTGVVLLLRNDQEGHPVICMDFTQGKKLELETLLRSVFYMGSVMAEDDAARTLGCVVLLSLNNTGDAGFMPPLMELLSRTLPIRVHSSHVALNPHRSIWSKTTRGNYTGVLGKALKSPKLTITPIVHHDETMNELVDSLGRYGLSKRILPSSIGGHWSFEGYQLWQELRLRYEWKLPLRGKPKDHGGPKIPPYEVTPLSQLSAAEKAQRRRRIHILTSRRRRERLRVMEMSIEDQAAALAETNRRLLNENHRLKMLLRDANSLVGVIR